MVSILVVEDDVKLNKLYSTILIKEGYQVISAANGFEALAITADTHIDLIITDIMMPDMDGYELVELLRDADYEYPVLVVTVRDSFDSLQEGFLLGIDDYMVKPINVNEMVLRVQAMLRRSKITSDRKIELNQLTLDDESKLVVYRGENLTLPQKEFQLLYKLLSYPNKIFTRHQLMDEFWGMDATTDERTIDVHINRLRERFKESNEFEIVTVRGLGYKVVKAE